MVHLLLTCVVGLVMSTAVRADDEPKQRDPIGETAHYKLDKNSKRTSSLIKSGIMDAEVKEKITDEQNGDQFNNNIKYDIDVKFIGRKQGENMVQVPAAYYTPEFMEDLRKNGTYEHPKFKAKHEGFADAKNMDGKEYKNCDKIFMYDIDTSAGLDGSQGLIALAKPLIDSAIAGLVAQYGPGILANEIEDLEIRATVHTDVPVLGAAKLDISGSVSGISFIAGADYLVPEKK